MKTMGTIERAMLEVTQTLTSPNFGPRASRPEQLLAA